MRRSRARIVEAARTCFAEHGYLGTTLDEVAARAQVTKRTIYNVYGDKETLFRASIEASIEVAEAFIGDLVTEIHGVEHPDIDLPHLAVRLSRDVLLGHVVALRRLVAHEAARFPDLARRYRARAPEAVMRALAAAFRELAARGRLTLVDAELAAEHFAFLVLGAELDRRMLGGPPYPGELRDRRAVEGAHAFLRAYGPPDSRGSTGRRRPRVDP